MQVPFYDIQRVNAVYQTELLQKASEIIVSGNFILGTELAAFEIEFARYCHSPFCAGVGNGLDALFMALKALDITAGDEVIVPAHTFVATWLAVSRTGAKPVPVEVRADTFNINPQLIEAAITKNTKAIVPVHLYGQVCEMDAILQIADKYKIAVVEDFAQAQGATYKGKTAGSFGVVNATSFYPSKNLGAFGDAGAVTSNSNKIFDKVKMLRNYGSEKKYVHEVAGYNSRLDGLQAALLRIKLKHLDVENAQRRKIAAMYTERLQNINGLVTPVQAKGAESVWHLYVIKAQKRDELAAYLASKNVGTIIHYPIPPHKQKAYAYLQVNAAALGVTEQIAATCLSLPMFGDLQENEIDYVAHCIKDFYKHS